MSVANVTVQMTCSAAISRGEAIPLQAIAYTVAGNAAQATVLQLRSSTCGIALDNYAIGAVGLFCVQGPCVALVQSTAGGSLTADSRLAFFGGRVLQFDASAVDTRRYVSIAADTGTLSAGVSVLKNVVMMGPNGLGISGGTA